MKPQHCTAFWVLLGVGFIGCSNAPSEEDNDEAGATGGVPSGGNSASGGLETTGGSSGAPQVASGGASPAPEPRYHPPPGFEDCKHAEIKKDCSNGWCKLPSSCFVMGAPEGEWYRGRNSQNLTAVAFTHSIEVQQKELTRTEWEAITGIPAPGPDGCTDPECPVAMVSWWDAVHAANLLSEQKSLDTCYDPVGCTGTLGVDLACEGVAEPDKSVYECEGYRLPTRAEAEYAARAGTISTWYSGDITPYWPDNVCAEDPALELIAWYCNNSGGRPHIGGELAPNDFGLYDMIGNLGEWSNEEAHYSSSPGGENPRGAVETNPNRLRFSPQYDGKSWVMRTAGLVSAPWEGRGNQLGFRLVRTLAD